MLCGHGLWLLVVTYSCRAYCLVTSSNVHLVSNLRLIWHDKKIAEAICKLLGYFQYRYDLRWQLALSSVVLWVYLANALSVDEAATLPCMRAWMDWQLDCVLISSVTSLNSVLWSPSTHRHVVGQAMFGIWSKINVPMTSLNRHNDRLALFIRFRTLAIQILQQLWTIR